MEMLYVSDVEATENEDCAAEMNKKWPPSV